ncbi:MAG: TldD/PmbA family protein [Candidatus Omnitrophota bacterium]
MKDDIRQLFYRLGLPPVEKLRQMITQPLTGKADFAEIYIQNTVSAGYKLSERLISSISSSYVTGAGIRVIKGSNTGFSYTEDLSEKSILRCIRDASEIAGTSQGFGVTGYTGKHNLYQVTPSIHADTSEKINILRRAENKAFSLSPHVEKVIVSLSENLKHVLILNSLGVEAYDTRPMLDFGLSVVIEKDGVREGASSGGGGRTGLSYFDRVSPEHLAEQAVQQAMHLLNAKPAPAGEMEVVLGAGESGVLLHESIGHPLEADFNYRGSSAFCGRIGEKVAADQCTIVDRGNIEFQRGSINIDDEGNDSGETVLIENGFLRTYMFDLITANHFHTKSHNGRRESFRDIPLPRMTNTMMLGGNYSVDEIIGSVKKGVYAKTFSGGQVDITSGDFVFSITEGYLIDNGKISDPIKGATLIGNGPEILKRITMVANDLTISDGKWTCGKEGQSVPVGVGIPTVKLSHITVGGTDND